MRLSLALCLLAVAAAALPIQYSPKYAKIVKYENDVDIGSHSFYYEQSDGTRHRQEGQLRNAGSKEEVYAIKGSYSWLGPNGVTYTVNYVADENGYHAEIQEDGPPPFSDVSPAVLASILG